MAVYDAPSANWQSGGYSFWDNDSNVESGTDLLGRFFNNISGRTALNQYNSAEAEKNRQFQLMMSNTAYTRAVKDMQAAGINPASLGGNATMSPASTPSGSAAQASNLRGSGGGVGRSILSFFLDAISHGIAGKMVSAVSARGFLNDETVERLGRFAKSAADSLSAVQESSKPKKMTKSQSVWDKPNDQLSDEDLNQMFAELGFKARKG